MKILLIIAIHPHPRMPAFFLGVRYLAALLKQNNFTFDLLDLENSRSSESQIKDYLRNSYYDVIGISGMTIAYPHVKRLIQIIKMYHPRAKIILGGVITDISSEILFNNLEVDAIVKGEAEGIVIDLLRNIANKKNIRDINGVITRGDKEKYRSMDRIYVEDLDSLPFPYYEDSIAKKIFQELRCGYIMSSRGCPFSCSYCEPISGKEMRYRKIDSVIEEILFLKKEFGIDYITFRDSTFTFNKERVFQLCENIISKGIKIKWMATSKPEINDLKLYEIMKKAGCFAIAMGIESGSSEILKRMNRDLTLISSIENAIFTVRKAGLTLIPSAMFGFFGENLKTVNETISFFERNNFYGWIMPHTIFPGTQDFLYAQDSGIIKVAEKYLISLSNYLSITTNVSAFSNFVWNLVKHYQDWKIYRNYKKKNQIVIENKSGKSGLKIASFKCNNCGGTFDMSIDRVFLKTLCPFCFKVSFISIKYLFFNFGISTTLKKFLSFKKDSIIAFCITDYYLRKLIRKIYNKEYWEQKMFNVP